MFWIVTQNGAKVKKTLTYSCIVPLFSLSEAAFNLCRISLILLSQPFLRVFRVPLGCLSSRKLLCVKLDSKRERNFVLTCCYEEGAGAAWRECHENSNLAPTRSKNQAVEMPTLSRQSAHGRQRASIATSKSRGTFSVRGWVDPRATVLLEELGKLRIPITSLEWSSGIFLRVKNGRQIRQTPHH
jgi:hypothetical protein